jgi:hypothetical protein
VRRADGGRAGPVGPGGESSVFGAGFPGAPDEPVELAEEVGIVVGAAGHGPVFGHRRPG